MSHYGPRSHTIEAIEAIETFVCLASRDEVFAIARSRETRSIYFALYIYLSLVCDGRKRYDRSLDESLLIRNYRIDEVSWRIASVHRREYNAGERLRS